MELQRRYEIAIALLSVIGKPISMWDLRFGDLAELATRCCRVTLVELQQFAEEVANRSAHQARAEQRQRDNLSKIMLIITDDPGCDEKYNLMRRERRPVPIEDLQSIFGQGYQEFILIRNQVHAMVLSEKLGTSIQVTNSPLPELDRQTNLFVIHEETLAKGTVYSFGNVYR